MEPGSILAAHVIYHSFANYVGVILFCYNKVLLFSYWTSSAKLAPSYSMVYF